MHIHPLFWAYMGQSENHIGWSTSFHLHQFILRTQKPIPVIFTKKYWELAELENDFFWLLGFSKKIYFCFFSMNINRPFTWGLCIMNGFFRILKKKVPKLICTRTTVCKFFVWVKQLISDEFSEIYLCYFLVCRLLAHAIFEETYFLK